MLWSWQQKRYSQGLIACCIDFSLLQQRQHPHHPNACPSLSILFTASADCSRDAGVQAMEDPTLQAAVHSGRRSLTVIGSGTPNHMENFVLTYLSLRICKSPVPLTEKQANLETSGLCVIGTNRSWTSAHSTRHRLWFSVQKVYCLHLWEMSVSWN